MKKIGILTHYYKSKNYGGNLQAYALVKVLKNISNDFMAEQISCDGTVSNINDKLKMFFKLSIFKKIKKIISVIFNRCNEIRTIFLDKKLNAEVIQIRHKAFEHFNQALIPHSAEIYNIDNLSNAHDRYDVFLVGSDQVWNIDNMANIYLLNNIDSKKIKMSYAASISKNTLTEVQKQIFKHSLHDFKALSVREENSVELLKDLSPINVQWHLDPTLLLSKEQWNEVCHKKFIDDNYLFCYFLGGDNNQRKIATEFAKKNNLKIVTMPYLLDHYRKCDETFGDIKLYDVSPEKFISLIKHANYIFTDSFHAVVFSGIYQKQYIVFERQGNKDMGTRIKTITSLFESEERFCDSKEKQNLSYISNLKDIDYTKELIKFKQKQSESLAYLRDNLK